MDESRPGLVQGMILDQSMEWSTIWSELLLFDLILIHLALHLLYMVHYLALFGFILLYLAVKHKLTNHKRLPCGHSLC